MVGGASGQVNRHRLFTAVKTWAGAPAPHNHTLKIKSLLLAQEAFWGRAAGVGTRSLELFRRRLLVLSCRSRRAGAGSELLQIVLQQTDFHATAADPLVLACFVSGCNRSVAHTDDKDAIHRDLVIEHQVAHDRIRHLLRGGDCGLTTTGREALDFDDVAALTLQRGG